MIIREFSTNQFAGLNNQMVKFEENLNVVLGPNEAGKSTIVNAIVATLFNNIKIGDKKTEDLILKEKYMPHPLVDHLRFTRLEFKRALSRINEEDASKRLLPMNSISWNVGHLAWQEQKFFCGMEQTKCFSPKSTAFSAMAAQPALTP